MVPETGRMGVLSSSARLPPSAALVRAMRSILPVHILPEGITSAGLADRCDGFFRRDPVLLQFVGIERDDDGALVSTERRRRGNTGQSREQGPHAVDREILHFALRVVVLLKTSWPTATLPGIEARDERLHGSRRHEGAGAVHVADRFRHGLGHVGALVEDQLHQRRALDALAFDVIDAGDVEEVILVVVSQVAFHLSRVHPP